MGRYEKMLDALLPIGAYSLNIGDTICKELRSYAQELDLFSQEVTQAQTECFIGTAVSQGLESYERIIGAPRNDLEPGERRGMLISLFNVTQNDFTPSGVRRFFASLGVQCSITEYPEVYDILIVPSGRTFSRAEQEYIRERAASFLPCHLTFTIEFRTCGWDDYDALDMTFDEWDALDMDWDALDKYEEV